MLTIMAGTSGATMMIGTIGGKCLTFVVTFQGRASRFDQSYRKGPEWYEGAGTARTRLTLGKAHSYAKLYSVRKDISLMSDHLFGSSLYLPSLSCRDKKLYL